MKKITLIALIFLSASATHAMKRSHDAQDESKSKRQKMYSEAQMEQVQQEQGLGHAF